MFSGTHKQSLIAFVGEVIIAINASGVSYKSNNVLSAVAGFARVYGVRLL